MRAYSSRAARYSSLRAARSLAACAAVRPTGLSRRLGFGFEDTAFDGRGRRASHGAMNRRAQDCVPRGREVVRRAIHASMSAGRYLTSRAPIRTVGISPLRLIDQTRVLGTASSSATCTAVSNRSPVRTRSGDLATSDSCMIVMAAIADSTAVRSATIAQLC